jgi:hypothetical protein
MKVKDKVRVPVLSWNCIRPQLLHEEHLISELWWSTCTQIQFQQLSMVHYLIIIPPCIPGSHAYRITSTKCRINTVVSPDDGHSHPKHVEKRNKHTKKNYVPSWLYLQGYQPSQIFQYFLLQLTVLTQPRLTNSFSDTLILLLSFKHHTHVSHIIISLCCKHTYCNVRQKKNLHMLGCLNFDT